MTPAATPRTNRPLPPFRLTPTDEEMLLSCGRYQYMTVEHWVRSFEDDGKRRYLQRRSQALSDNDYLIRLYITPLGGRGKGRNIFTHGTAGRDFAKSLGKRVPNRFRPSDVKRISYSHLAHSEAITDVLLSFDLLAKHDERITVTEMLHERFLTEQRFKVPVRLTHPVTGVITQEKMEVTPDAFVRVAASVGTGRRIFPLLIEVDRDSEEQIAFRAKIAKLHAFGTSETYRQLYQAKRFNVAFFVQAPKRNPVDRLSEVLRWTERELAQRNLVQDAPSFSFCALDPATTPPADLLLGANWYHPFSTSPHALIDLSESPKGGV
jgi:Replication-relaxation